MKRLSRRRPDRWNRQARLDSEYGSIEDVQLTDDHIAFFRDAGASEVFLTVIEAAPEDHGVDRNHVRQEARRYVLYGYLDGDADPANFSHQSGPVFGALWNGHLYTTYRHKADWADATLLENLFGEDRINANRPHPDDPPVSELDQDRFFLCTHPTPHLSENE